MTIRTSSTYPLRIATLPIGSRGGAIGVTFAPGKRQAKAMTGHWQRDLDIDLDAIRRWGASDLITLLEPHEFEELEIRLGFHPCSIFSAQRWSVFGERQRAC